MDEADACQRFFDSLTEAYLIRSIKLYRLKLDPVPHVPILPCLDHEAMLHEAIPRHAAAYVEDPESHDLHEIVIIPARALIEIDIASTAEEHSVDSRFTGRSGAAKAVSNVPGQDEPTLILAWRSARDERLPRTGVAAGHSQRRGLRAPRSLARAASHDRVAHGEAVPGRFLGGANPHPGRSSQRPVSLSMVSWEC